MPARSIRDTMQGTLHQFGKSLHLISDDPDPPAAPPASPTPPKTATGVAADKLENREQAIDKAVDAAS